MELLITSTQFNIVLFSALKQHAQGCIAPQSPSHFLFPIHSLFVLFLFSFYSLFIPSLFSFYSLFILFLFSFYSLFIPFLFAWFSLVIHFQYYILSRLFFLAIKSVNCFSDQTSTPSSRALLSFTVPLKRRKSFGYKK